MSAPQTWVDYRADRARADAEKMQAQAALESARAEAQARRVLAKQEAAERRELAAEQAQERAAARREQRRQERVTRRRQRVMAASDAVTDLVRALPVLAGVVACVAPTIIATKGQYTFALGPMQLGVLAPLFPAMLEGAAWLLAWRRWRAVRSGEPIARLTLGVWLLALVAAGMQLWHGQTMPGGSLEVGVAYALSSLVGFGLVELLARHARAAGHRARQRGLGFVRVLRFPRIAFAAWSRRVELGPDADADEAWRQAWVDRYGVEPGATRAERRAGRARIRATDKAMRMVGPNPDADKDEYRPGHEVDPPDFDPADEAEAEQSDTDHVDSAHGDAECGDGERVGPDFRDESLPLEWRIDLAVADELAAGREAPGRRRLAELLGLASDYPVRAVLERRARGSQEPHDPVLAAAQLRAELRSNGHGGGTN